MMENALVEVAAANVHRSAEGHTSVMAQKLRQQLGMTAGHAGKEGVHGGFGEGGGGC